MQLVDQTVKVWRTSNGELITELYDHLNYFTPLGFSEAGSGNSLITASENNLRKYSFREGFNQPLSEDELNGLSNPIFSRFTNSENELFSIFNGLLNNFSVHNDQWKRFL